MREVNIKTKLIFFYEDQFAYFRAVGIFAMKIGYGKKNQDKANLSDLIIYLMKKRGDKPFDIDFTEPKVKHNKTTLLYFSEESHTYLTKYFSKVLPKSLTAKQKKIAATRIILDLLVNFIIEKRGSNKDIVAIQKWIISEKKKKNERTK